MIYNWTSVTIERYVVPTLDPNVSYWPILNRMKLPYSGVGFVDGVFGSETHMFLNAGQVVDSAVQDFREAVGATFFDEAKDDPTLVPSSCVVHIDAIVLYVLTLRHMYCDSRDADLTLYLAEGYKSAWKRATIYRREQAAYLKKWLVGDLFPEEVPAAVSDGIPFYTIKPPTTARSL